MASTFSEAVKRAKVPILVLDNKWHRLFALGKKPGEVVALEEEIKQLLERQSTASAQEKALKKVKSDILESIRQGMGDESADKKAEEHKRLVDEANAKISAIEDELLDLPNLIKEKNNELMVLTMEFCYERLSINTKEAKEIAEWITQMREEVKKKVIKKQNREINNKEIYAYMHDIFGPEILDQFDKEETDFSLDEHDTGRWDDKEKKKS